MERPFLEADETNAEKSGGFRHITVTKFFGNAWPKTTLLSAFLTESPYGATLPYRVRREYTHGLGDRSLKPRSMENSRVHPQPTEDFKNLAMRLAGFGLRIFAEFGLGGPSATIPGIGLSIEDYVWEVLEGYASGALVFEPGKGALFSLLARALKNDIIDALRRAAHLREEARPTQASEDETERNRAALDELPSVSCDVDTALNEARYRERMFAKLANEPELREVAEAILDLDLRKPQEIADAIGITVIEYQNRKKRMRRRLIQFQAEEESEHECTAND